MPTHVSRLVKVLLVFSVLLLTGPVSSHEIKVPEDIGELALHKISDAVFVIHGLQKLPDNNNQGFISNSAIVLTRAGVVVVDSGGSLEVGQLIIRKIQEKTDQPVIAVFNTHLHGDHWLGNAAIRKAFPNAGFYAHRDAIRRLNSGEAEQWQTIFSQMTATPLKEIEIVLPDKPLDGNETMHFGDTTFSMHHTGHAHTDSDIMIEMPAEKILFSGDIIEYGRAVSSDVPQDFDIKGQIKALKYALDLPVETYVPGHGTSGGKEIPTAALKFLSVLHESVKRNYDEGLQDFEMAEAVKTDLSAFSHWFGFDQLGRMISYVYQQVENEDFQ